MPTLSPAPSLTPSPVSTTSDNSNHRPFAGGLLRAAWRTRRLGKGSSDKLNLIRDQDRLLDPNRAILHVLGYVIFHQRRLLRRAPTHARNLLGIQLQDMSFIRPGIFLVPDEPKMG